MSIEPLTEPGGLKQDRLLTHARPAVPTGVFRFSWLLTAVMAAMIARVTLFAYKRPTDEFAAVNLSAWLAIILTATGLLLFFIAPPRNRILRAIRRTSLFYFVTYYLVALLSAAWSVLPLFSGYRGTEVLSQILVAPLVLYYSRSFERAEKFLLHFSLAASVMSLLGTWRLTGVALGHQALHSNVYPAVTGAICVYCLGESVRAGAQRKRWLRKWALVFGCLTLAGTSSGSMIATATGVLIIGFFERMDKRVLWAGAVAVLIVLGAGGVLRDFWWEMFFAQKEVEKVASLSGRRHLFEAYVEAVKERPIYGHGFAVVSRIGNRYGTVATTSAHNGFFEMILGAGVIGLFLGLAWLISLARELVAAMRHRMPGAVGVSGALVVFSVNNLTISAYGGAWNVVVTHVALVISLFVLYVRLPVSRRLAPAGGRFGPLLRGRRR
jgi:O-antigen ligase